MTTNNQAPASFVQQQQYNDEIDLVDIVTVLIRRKKLILGIAVVTVCIGLFYAFIQQQVYQVETILLPPSLENIQALNVISSGDVKISDVKISDVVAAFTNNIKSRKLRKAFFDKFKILETLSASSTRAFTKKDKNDYFEDFSKALKVKGDKKSNNINITLEGVDKVKIGLWLDSIVVMASQETISQLVKDFQSNIDSKIKSIKINVASKRFLSKKRRQDEIMKLQESIEIAKELGIHDHLFVPDFDVRPSRVVSAGIKNIIKSISDVQNISTYMKGTKVLQAEMNSLKSRKTDDIHIVGLRDLEERLVRLESINIKKDKLQIIIVDKKATVNIEPIRPKRILIVILSLILGVILGICGVFILEFINNFKKQADKSGLDTV